MLSKIITKNSVYIRDFRAFKVRRLRTTDYELLLDERCPFFVTLG